MAGAIATAQSIEVSLQPENPKIEPETQQPVIELLINTQSSPGDELMNAQIHLHR
jgi:hypothetical protein